MLAQINSNEIFQLFEYTHAQDKYIYVICECKYSKWEVGTELLLITDNGEHIMFEDINDFCLEINKYDIKKITISEDYINKIVTIYCDDLKISFVICK